MKKTLSLCVMVCSMAAASFAQSVTNTITGLDYTVTSATGKIYGSNDEDYVYSTGTKDVQLILKDGLNGRHAVLTNGVVVERPQEWTDTNNELLVQRSGTEGVDLVITIYRKGIDGKIYKHDWAEPAA